jgi:excisionase family DNA binding protein
MTTFRYPAFFSPVDEQRIAREWQLAVATLKHTSGDPDAAALHAVRQVLKVVAFRLQRYRDRQPADLAAAAIDLRDQVIAQIDHVRTTIQTTLDEFEQIVLADLSQYAWWPADPQSVREPAGTDQPHASSVLAGVQRRADLDDVGSLVSVQEAADRLGVTAVTIRRMQKAGKLPSIRVGSKLIRIPLRAVQQLIATGLYPRTR